MYEEQLKARAKLVPESRLADLMQETDEIITIIVASIKTLGAKRRKPKPSILGGDFNISDSMVP
jgi:hypothetical protein